MRSNFKAFIAAIFLCFVGLVIHLGQLVKGLRLLVADFCNKQSLFSVLKAATKSKVVLASSLDNPGSCYLTAGLLQW